MKYALSLFLFLFVQSSQAFTITSFNDSPALMNVLEFMKDSGLDLLVSNRVSEKKLKISDLTACTDVQAAVVINDIEVAIQNVLRYYPDEELPLDDAYNDLATYLGSFTFKKCTLSTSNDRMKVKTNYYESSTGSIHIKVDTITLIAR